MARDRGMTAVPRRRLWRLNKENMLPTFRLAREADSARLIAFMEEFYAGEKIPFDAHAASSVMSRLLRDPALGRVWLILAGDRPVGYVAITLGFSLEYRGRDAFIDELFIEESSRGRGLGRATLAFVEAACRDLGVQALHLEVERSNEAGQGLYLAAGFSGNARQLLTKRLSTRRPDRG